jgi:hypothetical protein
MSDDLENANADLHAAEEDVRAADEVLHAAETELEAAEQAIDDAEHHEHKLTVTVHNEDAGGDPLVFHDSKEALVSAVIAQLYTALGVARKPDDRLKCIANGDNVFSHETETLGHYAERVCEKLEWAWSGKSGGA